MLDLRDVGGRVETVIPGSVTAGIAGRSPVEGEKWNLSPEDVAEAVLVVVFRQRQALASQVDLRPSRSATKCPLSP